MSILAQLFNVVLAAFIISTMLSAGLGTSLGFLGQTLSNVRLASLVLVVNLVLIPLLGWGIATLLALPASAFIAFILWASSPGAPTSVKLAMLQRGDAVAGASMQIVLALLGSVTFAVTASLVLSAAKVGGSFSVPVGNLVQTIAAVQIAPFAIGLALRNRVPRFAHKWRPLVLAISNVTLILVLADALITDWRDLVGTLSSRVLPATLLFTLGALALGGLLASGPARTRTTMATLAPMRSSGPVFAAIAIGFGGNPAILGEASAMALVILFTTTLVAWYIGRRRADATSNGGEPLGAAGTDSQQAADIGSDQVSQPVVSRQRPRWGMVARRPHTRGAGSLAGNRRVDPARTDDHRFRMVRV